MKAYFYASTLVLARLGATFATKRALARLLSTLLCCIVIVVRRFSSLGGPYAFLVLALKELVFSVQQSLAQQLELTILNILGALLGIAASSLAKFIASKLTGSSARAICAIFLVLISFFAGLAKSRLPRLHLSTRICCFVSVWILTDDVDDSKHILATSGNFLWVTISAAAICLASLLVVMFLTHWPSTNFERDIASTLAVVQRCLEIGMHLAFPRPSDPIVDKAEYQALKADLLRRSVQLNENYSQAAFELRMGRLSLRSTRPLISTIEHLRRELAWGMPLRKSTKPITPRGYQNDIRRTYDILQSPALSRSPSAYHVNELSFTELATSARRLGNALVVATQQVRRTILLVFHQKAPSLRLFAWSHPAADEADIGNEYGKGQWIYSQLVALHKAEMDLVTSRDHSRTELGKVISGMARLNEQINCSLTMIALLQMAQELHVALRIAQRFVTQYNTSRSRLWLPHISLAWLGVPPSPVVSDDPNVQSSVWSASDASLTRIPTDDIAQEWKQGLREQAFRVDLRRTAKDTARVHISEPLAGHDVHHFGKISWTERTIRGIHHVWTIRPTLKLRMKLWRILKALKHSSHLRHAVKNAIGVALLTFPAFMSAGSPGRRWFVTVHGQWMTISYLWVLETNTGATWRTGYLRILGTICGATYAYITWVICKVNPYGLTVLVTLADIPVTWLITQTNLKPFAVPAFVALPPIVFSRYFIVEQHPSESVATLALLRAGMISAGMITALLMNSLVFPRHCRVYFLSFTSRTLGLLTDLYLALSHEIFQDHPALSKDDRKKALKLELEVRDALHRLSILNVTMHSEFALLPKPLRHYRRVVTLLQDTLDLLTGLRKIRENIPRKLSVTEVYKERRDFMSCVCVTLFACQHAFKAREPLPQFLPSARHAFESLEEHIQERIRQANQDERNPIGMPLVNAFAEQEVLRNMVGTLEALLEITGSLFGTSAWLTHDSHITRTTLNDDPLGDQGWYSTFRHMEP